MNGVMNIFRDSTSTLAATDPNLAELRSLMAVPQADLKSH